MSIGLSLEDARAFDAADPLSAFRQEFRVPAGTVYLDGNSLGALSQRASDSVSDVVANQWGKTLIASWLVHGWMTLPRRVGDKIAKLIGAAPGEVVVADSTSVNLFKCVSAALQLRPERRLVVSEPGNFPTDLYMLQGMQRAVNGGLEVRLAARDDLLSQINSEVAAVVLTHVHYKTAHRHDMAGITRRVHECGGLAIWDLSHSAGAVEVDLNECGADFAVGCGYKYLNGGPGSPAFLFAAQRHQDKVVSPLTGWLGHAHPFEFRDDYEPAAGVDRFLCGTHPVLGLTCLEAAVDLMLRVDSSKLWEKSRRLCDYFIDLVDRRCAELGAEVVTPRDASARGSHVGVRHPSALPVIENLISRGVIGDYRAPDIMRFGFAPLYVSFEDVWRGVDVLHDILRERSWDRPEFHVRRASG